MAAMPELVVAVVMLAWLVAAWPFIRRRCRNERRARDLLRQIERMRREDDRLLHLEDRDER